MGIQYPDAFTAITSRHRLEQVIEFAIALTDTLHGDKNLEET